jgi:WD40 repeat protein
MTTVSPTPDPRADPQAAADADDVQTYRYEAFISYRHVPLDRKWAIWLHRSLEGFRTPKRLARNRRLPAALGRVFRDEEELAASADLSAAIEEALRHSRWLIVVCSRSTPGSKWVNEEIHRFRQLGRSARIRALLVDGEPEQAFPPALYEIASATPVETTDEDFRPSDGHERKEPLAADVRKREDESARATRRLALLRLVAPMLACKFDDLRQRDNERALQRTRRVLTAALAALALIAGLAAVAVTQRNRSLATLADMYAERGRLEWTAHRPSRALPYLAEARRLGRADSSLSRLLRLALVRSVPDDVVTEGDDNFIGAVVGLNDTRLITHQYDGRITVWDVTSERAKDPLLLGRGQGLLRLSADGQRVMLVRSDGTFAAWDLVATSGVPAASFPSLASGRVDVDAAGVRFAHFGDATVTVRDNTTGRQMEWQPHASPPPRPGGGRVGAIMDAHVNQEGTRLLTSGADGTAAIWSMQGEAIAVLPVASAVRARRPDSSAEQVQSAVFSPDGRLVATHCAGDVDVWDAAAGHHLARALPATLDVSSLMFSPDSRLLAVVTSDGRFWLWDADSRVARGPLGLPHRGGGRHTLFAFSPDSRLFLTSGWDVTALWHTTDPFRGAPALRFDRDVWSVGFSRDASWLITVERGGVSRWRLSDRMPRIMEPANPRHRHGGHVWFGAFSADGRRVVTAGADRTVKVWDAGTGTLVTTPCLHESPFHMAALSPDGDEVTAVSADHTVCRADIPDTARQDGLALLEEGKPSRAHFARYTRDGRFIVTIEDDKLVHVWDRRSGTFRHALDEQALPFALDTAISEDGTRALTVADDGVARVWDPLARTVVSRLAEPLDVRACATFSPDGLRLITGMPDEPPRIWDTRTGALVRELRKDLISLPRSITDPHAWRVWFSARGDRILTAFTVAGPVIWNAVTGEMVATLEDEADVRSAAFSGDGEVVLTGGAGGAKLWDTRSGVLLHVLDTPAGGVTAVGFDGAGDQVVAVGNGPPRVWNVGPSRLDDAETARVVACHTQWRLQGGLLVGRPDEPSDCRSSP